MTPIPLIITHVIMMNPSDDQNADETTRMLFSAALTGPTSETTTALAKNDR